MKLVVLLLYGALRSVSSDFFHEPSRTDLKPSGKGLETSDFGFSLAYQDSASPKLVVGAPRQGFVGQVYSCPLKDLSDPINCTMIDMSSLEIENKTKMAREEINPDQNFFFGSSIAATPDYFLTCAPLLTKTITTKEKIGDKPKKVFVHTPDAFGACFLYNDTTSTYSEWKDNSVRLANKFSDKKLKPKIKFSNTKQIRGGGLGWSTLADNGYLMAVKTAFLLDFLYVDINQPQDVTKSFLENNLKDHYAELNNYFNTGYGLAVGNFFNQSMYVYAVSLRYINLQGKILFLEKNETSGMLEIMHDPKKSSLNPYYIDQKVLGTMFGYALGAADINRDGLSDLLVGDPAHVDEVYKRESGALHIYVGGDLLSRNDKYRMRTVLANKENGRFGSAIATNDIDGDSIAEIFVSAPLENSGYGVVYVISGYELNQALFRDDGFKQILLSELARTQALRGDDGSKKFGFSLQTIKDIDGNGCDELAVGSPANSSVHVFRCLPAVNTSISIELIGDEIVKEDANIERTVLVCLNVTISPKCKSAVGSISVNSSITGNVSIAEPTFVYELKKDRKERHCENVKVYFKNSGSGEYTFTTKVNMLNVDKNGDRRVKDFKPWAVLSPYSETVKRKVIRRFCHGKECEPKLSYEIYWSGDTSIDTSISQNGTVSIVVNNTGHDAISTYIRLIVRGARISQTNQCFRENGTDAYTCPLPKPLKRDSAFAIALVLNMTEPINIPKLDITAQLYDDAFSTIHYDEKHLEINYRLDTSPVLLIGSKHNFTITDKDLKDNIDISGDSHVYHISNNGSVTWLNILAVLKVTNQSLIMNVKLVTTEVCQQHYIDDDYSNFIFYCQVTLKPGAVKKIIANIDMSKKFIKTNIILEDLGTSSELSLLLKPTHEILHVRSSTQIVFKEILTVGNRKEIIIPIVVLVAISLLLLLIFVLYQYGFFKRTQKKRLDVLRESVRKRSIRLASESSRGRKPSTVDGDHCDIEVVDDSAFEEVDITPSQQTSKDDVMLIEETAQIHKESVAEV